MLSGDSGLGQPDALQGALMRFTSQRAPLPIILADIQALARSTQPRHSQGTPLKGHNVNEGLGLSVVLRFLQAVAAMPYARPATLPEALHHLQALQSLLPQPTDVGTSDNTLEPWGMGLVGLMLVDGLRGLERFAADLPTPLSDHIMKVGQRLVEALGAAHQTMSGFSEMLG